MSGPHGLWLQEYVEDAVRRQICTRIYCTTCGAREFRNGFWSALAAETGREGAAASDLSDIEAAARALRLVTPPDEMRWEFDQAVRLLLHELWSSCYPLGRIYLLAPLEGSWAGRLLEGMIEHHEAREAARRAHAEFNSPEQIARRREEKKRLKQERHQQRLAEKKERDRLYWERKRKEES